MGGNQPEKKGKNFQVKNPEVFELPSSEKKEFWGKDARVKKINLKKIKHLKTNKHFPVHKKGPYFVCSGCPNEHTIPLNPAKYTTTPEGKIVKLDKISNK